jgi:hypothetical protein
VNAGSQTAPPGMKATPAAIAGFAKIQENTPRNGLTEEKKVIPGATRNDTENRLCMSTIKSPVLSDHKAKKIRSKIGETITGNCPPPHSRPVQLNVWIQIDLYKAI